MEPIILASESPRRQEYFRLLGLPFSVVPAKIDERAVTATGPRKLAETLAVKKVQEVAERIRRGQGPRWIFGADTIVAIGREVFGKPEDRNDAARILGRLSGRGHKVITAMALYNTETETISRREAVCTVTFARLSVEEINWYLDTEEWQGAAGGYRLQGRGGCFITSVKGSPSNVVGLPLRDFYDMLKSNGYPYGP
ncbi:MAG: Maf family protein [Treponema sp.]|jgi:septum formation protein|nr:Maf family protein [Treponema sp.]